MYIILSQHLHCHSTRPTRLAAILSDSGMKIGMSVYIEKSYTGDFMLGEWLPCSASAEIVSDFAENEVTLSDVCRWSKSDRLVCQWYWNVQYCSSGTGTSSHGCMMIPAQYKRYKEISVASVMPG